MGTELTAKLEELRNTIQDEELGGKRAQLIQDAIDLSQQPPVYAMSRDYEALYDHLVKGGEAIVRWMGRDILEAHTWTKESVNGLPLQGFTNRCGHINLEWLAPSPQAVTVDGKWISVDERLPDMGESVLVWPHPHVCRYGLWDYYGVEQLAGFHSWDSGNDTDSIVPGVTHWMPIPSAPASTNT